jgi:hypothetical protein
MSQSETNDETKTLEEWCLSCYKNYYGDTADCMHCMYEQFLHEIIDEPLLWEPKEDENS